MLEHNHVRRDHEKSRICNDKKYTIIAVILEVSNYSKLTLGVS
jgi:hypothetical protein